MRARRAGDELVGRKTVAGGLLARKQAKRVRLSLRAPPAELPAIGAIALAGAFGQIDVDFVANFLAVAAAVIRLLHDGSPSIDRCDAVNERCSNKNGQEDGVAASAFSICGLRVVSRLRSVISPISL